MRAGGVRDDRAFWHPLQQRRPHRWIVAHMSDWLGPRIVMIGWIILAFLAVWAVLGVSNVVWHALT